MSGPPDPLDPIDYPEWLDALIEGLPSEDEVARQAAAVDLITDTLGLPPDLYQADVPGFDLVNDLGVASAMLAQYRESPAATRTGRIADAVVAGGFDLLMGKTFGAHVIDGFTGSHIGNALSSFSSGLVTRIEGAMTGRRRAMNRYQSQNEGLQRGPTGELMGRLFKRGES